MDKYILWKSFQKFIKTQAKNQKIQNTVSNLINSLDSNLEIEKDENAISFVPPFARYPYEVCLLYTSPSPRD